MEIQPLGTFIFTISAGILALILAEKTRFPSILFLLSFGVLLGPEFANLIQPKIFRSEFPHYISLMVALILFEGGTSLKFNQFKEISGSVKNLLTVGVLFTLISISLTVHWIADLPWDRSFLFGAVMVVTGPTVILPILRRIRIKDKLNNILKWESILIDPLGVIIAVVLFEIFLTEKVGIMGGLILFGSKLLLGVSLGLLAGWIIYVGLNKEYFLRLEGEEIGGPFSIGTNLLFYGISEWLLPHSGLVTATTAGIFIGNKKFAFQEQIFQFKKQITLFALSILFILLSSNVPVRATAGILREGLIILGVMIFLVRPLSVFLSTWNESKLSFSEKTFLGSLAPRGIVSASLASLFAIELEQMTLSTGGEFLPLTFLVIAGTIVFYALVCPFSAKLLGAIAPPGDGYLIIGANPFGFLIGKELQQREFFVKFIDTNPSLCRTARKLGFKATTGSGFDHDFLEDLDFAGIGNVLALTPNHEVNVLSSQSMARYVNRHSLFRVWDKADQWDKVTSNAYDRSLGRPFPVRINSKMDDSTFWIKIEEGEYEIKTRKLTNELKITPENLKEQNIPVPLFTLSNNKKLTIAYPNVILPTESDLVYLEFKN